MIYRTLYQQDKNDNVRIWYMETEGAKFRTISGIKDGNLVISSWTTAIGKNIGKKNETSGEEQANLEVIAQYKHKMSRKYHETEDTISEGAKFIQPMLASKYEVWENGKLDWFNVFTQPKLDGARCLVTKQGMFSREGKEFISAPHISKELEDFFIDNPDVILDGELYNHDLKDDFNTIMSLIKQKKPTPDDLRKSEELVQYHIYDIVSSEPFSERTGFVSRVVDRINSTKIVAVTTWKVEDAATLDQYYALFLEDGYEGQMVRLDYPYEQTRSKTLMKRKEFEDREFAVSKIIEGIGNWSGYAKAVEFILPNDQRLENGERPKAGIKGNQDFAKALLNGPVPKTVTVRYQNLTPLGIPRFPIAVAFYENKRDI